MTSFMALDSVRSFLRLKDVTITCRRMRRSLSIGRSSPVQWRKVGRSWRLRMYSSCLLCVRIEIDQLKCVNCWVIIHCLSVSCTKINHSCCALVIWSSLQLTSKQWIFTQQFTAGADLFLNRTWPVFLWLYTYEWDMNSIHKCFWKISHGNHFSYIQTRVILYGLPCDKTCLRGFGKSDIQTSLPSYRD